MHNTIAVEFIHVQTCESGSNRHLNVMDESQMSGQSLLAVILLGVLLVFTEVGQSIDASAVRHFLSYLGDQGSILDQASLV